MKQKIVIKVQLDSDKGRSKAMKLVASADGVDLVAIEGEERNLLVVIGDGVDSVSLANMLRKKIGPANIVSVSKAKKKKLASYSSFEEPRMEYLPEWRPPYPPPSSHIIVHDAPYNTNSSDCSIM